jgi:hypothetical protein
VPGGAYAETVRSAAAGAVVTLVLLVVVAATTLAVVVIVIAVSALGAVVGPVAETSAERAHVGSFHRG